MSFLCDANEYALSKDVDVALWHAFREHNKQPILREAFDDFVIVDATRHNQFDEFRLAEITPDTCYLEMNTLLCSYRAENSHLSFETTKKYGRNYIKLTSDQVDQLIEWIHQKRTEYNTGIVYIMTACMHACLYAPYTQLTTVSCVYRYT